MAIHGHTGAVFFFYTSLYCLDCLPPPCMDAVAIDAVVKVRGAGGLSPLLRFEPPCNSMSPLIESIKFILCPNNAKLVGLEWVWGLLQPNFVR